MTKARMLMVAGLLALGTSAAEAQRGSTSGLFGGIQYTGASVDLKEAGNEVDFGGGFGVHAGIGFGQRFALLVNYDKTKQSASGAGGNDVDLAQFDALARIYLFGGKDWIVRPFVTGGITGRVATEDGAGSAEFDGTSPTAGGGLSIALIPRIHLTGSALWTFGNLTNKEATVGANNEYKSTGTRVQVGASLYLFGN